MNYAYVGHVCISSKQGQAQPQGHIATFDRSRQSQLAEQRKGVMDLCEKLMHFEHFAISWDITCHQKPRQDGHPRKTPRSRNYLHWGRAFLSIRCEVDPPPFMPTRAPRTNSFQQINKPTVTNQHHATTPLPQPRQSTCEINARTHIVALVIHGLLHFPRHSYYGPYVPLESSSRVVLCIINNEKDLLVTCD